MKPDAIGVELYANGEKDGGPVVQQMTPGERLAGADAGLTYAARVAATRPASDYTPRIVPHHEDVSVPLEASSILWLDAPSWR
jgi:starch phosphorylase